MFEVLKMCRGVHY
jgi:hypothetical protein